MNDELKKALVDSLDLLKTGLEKGSDFMLEQAPMVVQEYITYIRITTTIHVGLAVLLFFVMPYTLYKYAKFMDGPSRGETIEILFGIGGAAAHLAGLVLFITGLCNITTCVMSWVAPRVLILEKIAEIVK